MLIQYVPLGTYCLLENKSIFLGGNYFEGLGNFNYR